MYNAVLACAEEWRVCALKKQSSACAMNLLLRSGLIANLIFFCGGSLSLNFPYAEI